MKRIFWIAGVVTTVAISLGFAACSSPAIDNTQYGPPDAGKPDAAYCLVSADCPTSQGPQACGYPVADKCSARGVCVTTNTGAKCSTSSKVCGCNGDLVDTCAMPDGYVNGGPTNGQSPVDVDGSASCAIGSH